jgi:RNA polymerase sigma-70 factor (ECF subfamily)
MITRKQDNSHSEMNNEQLLTGCLSGDKQCQRMLFRRYRDIVYSVVRNSLGPNFDKDDVIQQVFISVFRSLKSFKGLSSLDTWVCRIASKVCIDQLRKKYRKRQLPMITSVDFDENRFSSSDFDPEEEKEQKELHSQIYKGLEKVSVEKRIVLTMFEIEGFSLYEIADILKKPVGTIKSRLFHGRKELAMHMRHYFDKTP